MSLAVSIIWSRIAWPSLVARYLVCRGARDRRFINLQQTFVICLCRVELLEVLSAGVPHGLERCGPSPSPLHFAGQITCVARRKMQTVPSVYYDLLDTAQVRSDYWCAARKGFHQCHGKSFIANTRNDQSRCVFDSCVNIWLAQPSSEGNIR